MSVLENSNILQISSQFKKVLVTWQIRGLLISPNYARKPIPRSNLPSDQHPFNNAKVIISWQVEYVQYLQSHPRVFTFTLASTITQLDSEAWSSDPGLILDHEVSWRSRAVSVYSTQLEDDNDHDEAKMKHRRTRTSGLTTLCHWEFS